MPDIRDMSYEKLLLDALRIVPFKKRDIALSNSNLAKAVTMNENLESLGFTLKPADLVEMASSSSLDGFYDKVSSMMSTVKAKPMYPDFPTQVMGMDEAQFRFHQMVHYFSTYGIEFLTGQDVTHGWLPAEAGLVSDTEKTKADDRLLKAEAIGLIDEKEMYTAPFEQILSKRERMTDMEREIVKRCALSGQIDFSRKYAIPFKENLEDIFSIIAEAGASGKVSRQEASIMLYNICQHPGDVTRNVRRYLAANKYHLRTTEKKMFVDVYEMFTPAAFRENLSVSNKNKTVVREVFKRLDFIKFAHNPEMIRSVREMDSLNSWEGKARQKIENHEPDAVRFAAQRPGMLLRMASFALRNGYSQEEITAELMKSCDQLSLQTLVSQLNRNDSPESYSKGYAIRNEQLSRALRKAENVLYQFSTQDSKKTQAVRSRVAHLNAAKTAAEEKEARRAASAIDSRPIQKEIFHDVLKGRLGILDTPIRGKKVYLDQEAYDFKEFSADPSQKSASQGYLPRDVVKKIPEDVKAARFFVYWNDPERVDLDLHGYGVTKDGYPIHIGWNGNFRNHGIVHSGDITHSDAAEYIDVDFSNSDIKEIAMNLDVYYHSDCPGPRYFSQIAECYGGVMAVNQIGKDVRLYDSANCLFSDDIKNPIKTIRYATIDVPARKIRYQCCDIEQAEVMDNIIYQMKNHQPVEYTLDTYLHDLADAQGAVIVDTPEEADIILTLTKPLTDKEFSLIDANYFYDSPVLGQERERERLNDIKLPDIGIGDDLPDISIRDDLPDIGIGDAGSVSADISAEFCKEDNKSSHRIAIPPRHTANTNPAHRSNHNHGYENR